jgi:hypothetical protein
MEAEYLRFKSRFKRLSARRHNSALVTARLYTCSMSAHLTPFAGKSVLRKTPENTGRSEQVVGEFGVATLVTAAVGIL